MNNVTGIKLSSFLVHGPCFEDSLSAVVTFAYIDIDDDNNNDDDDDFDLSFLFFFSLLIYLFLVRIYLSYISACSPVCSLRNKL